MSHATDDEAMAAAREAAVGKEGAGVAEAGPHDRRRRGQHLQVVKGRLKGRVFRVCVRDGCGFVSVCSCLWVVCVCVVCVWVRVFRLCVCVCVSIF